MSTFTRFVPQARPRPAAPGENYLNVAFGWKSWLLTVDHKRIAILYLISITLMFFVGGE
jgi:cytochrome c oxidase subunit 1